MSIDMSVGETNYPIGIPSNTAIDGYKTLAVLDPVMNDLVSYLSYWLNRELGTYFAATMASIGLPYTQLINPSNCIFVPLTLVGKQELQNVPLMVFEPIEDDEQDWTSVQKCNARKINIHYIMAPMSAGNLTVFYPFFSAISNVIKFALEKNTKDNTQLIFSNVDFVIGKTKYGTLQTDSSNLFPTIQIELIIRDYRQAGPDLYGAIAPTAADVELDNLSKSDSTSTAIDFIQSIDGYYPPDNSNYVDIFSQN